MSWPFAFSFSWPFLAFCEALFLTFLEHLFCCGNREGSGDNRCRGVGYKRHIAKDTVVLAWWLGTRGHFSKRER